MKTCVFKVIKQIHPYNNTMLQKKYKNKNRWSRVIFFMVHISTDIDIFIEKMLILLPQDIVLYIVKKYIYLPKNKLVIL